MQLSSYIYESNVTYIEVDFHTPFIQKYSKYSLKHKISGTFFPYVCA